MMHHFMNEKINRTVEEKIYSLIPCIINRMQNNTGVKKV